MGFNSCVVDGCTSLWRFLGAVQYGLCTRMGVHTMIIFDLVRLACWSLRCWLCAFHSPGALIDVWYNGCARFVEILSCLGPYSTVFARGLELHTMIIVIWSVLHAGPWGVGCVLLFHSQGTSIDVWYNGCTSFCGDTCIPGPYSTVFAQGLEYIP